ncbi:HAD-IA family hydrolase [Qipengyuania atrilutea]|uniref:HAD-IA family hydrolase n=1 Tax=Qipengyuania atrilutea TaxID=2744473 RepID=A0A850H6K3_9SPHN|nr:HAD-IA family hydrolase [Actirhodobacter atriluteus]NVD45433.1 HAD-IA family hydrolase [Actirhodobacter atriluteus]
MSRRLAVFDCDGTLVDGQAGICEAMETACGAAGIAVPSRQAIRRIVGLSLPQAMFHLAPDTTPDQRSYAVEVYKDAYRTSRTEGRLYEPLFAGIADLLHDLRAEGWLLGVATGKSDRGLKACLKQHRIEHLFTTLQTADHHPSKPDPAMLVAALAEADVEPRDAVMIGDTSFDITMAHAAGVRAVGVAWGYHSVAELTAEGADTVVREPGELKGLLVE